MSAVTYLVPFPAAGSPEERIDLVPLAVDDPAISVMDAAAERGDGAFEAWGVADGASQELDAHLARLAKSLAMLDLPEADLGRLAETAGRIARTADPAKNMVLKLVVTRGGMDRATPHAWFVLFEAADFTEERTDGFAIVTADRGFDSGYAEREPWSLIGAKTLSYALNMAAIREAKRRGAKDMLFVTSDGILLEAPQSTLILRRDGVLRTPDPRLGILHGTTQQAVFRWAEEHGIGTEYGRYTRDDLLGADAAWYASSVRLLTPITSVDGHALPVDTEQTAAINAHLLARRA
ncbi:aminotransferase class IV [Microbacterium indicum]|uniref:aminotransferase class IV n=1 Tax=Microbacterium indicum TaxID=358100 RepID=UPI00041387C8|nr:aminotransferase class IV [Microbacterium indicum]